MDTRGRLIVGIDYSLTCPAVSFNIGRNSEFKENYSYYLTDSQKLVGKFAESIMGNLHKPYKSEEERYENIADWVLRGINSLSLNGEMFEPLVFIEGYSMGSRGKVFNIAENTEVLKYKLYKAKIPFHVVPPTVIKKFYTGKGNSDKAAMVVQFIKETGLDLQNIMTPKRKLGSPCIDIVDSWAIVKYGLDFAAKL